MYATKNKQQSSGQPVFCSIFQRFFQLAKSISITLHPSSLIAGVDTIQNDNLLSIERAIYGLGYVSV